LAGFDAPLTTESTKFPAFSQLAGKFGFRDGFARDCPLQQGVGRTSDHDKAQVEVAVRYEGRVLQIPEQRHPRHFVKVTVQVHEYPDGTSSRRA